MCTRSRSHLNYSSAPCLHFALFCFSLITYCKCIVGPDFGCVSHFPATDMSMRDFIKAIQQRPMLWDRSNNDYKNRRLKKLQWKQLEALSKDKQSVAQLRKKWKNLKDLYRKELRKWYNTGYSNWKNFEDLSFLKEEILQNGHFNYEHTNKNEDSTDNEEINVLGEDYVTVKKEENALDSDEDFNRPLVVTTSTNNSRKRKSNKEETLAPQQSDEEFIESSSSAPQKKRFSEDYHFLMTLLPLMQKFSSAQKLRVRNKINDVILAEVEKNEDSYFD